MIRSRGEQGETDKEPCRLLDLASGCIGLHVDECFPLGDSCAMSQFPICRLGALASPGSGDEVSLERGCFVNTFLQFHDSREYRNISFSRIGVRV